MRFTMFPDRRALTKTDHNLPWDAICDGIANAAEYADKESCPLISLAVYGDKRSHNNSLRHAGNVECIAGLEGEHDAGTFSIEDAAERAKQSGFRCILHTTGSHTPQAHRWRILVPLSREHPLSEREHLMDRLNGALSGALTNESWTPSQSFFVGRVRGVPYTCIHVA